MKVLFPLCPKSPVKLGVTRAKLSQEEELSGLCDMVFSCIYKMAWNSLCSPEWPQTGLRTGLYSVYSDIQLWLLHGDYSAHSR